MKKLMILFALVLGGTLAHAQQGYNHGAHHNGQRGYNQGARGNQGHVRHNQGQRHVRYNQGQRNVRYNNNGWRAQNGWQRRGQVTTRRYNGYGNGTYYEGGVSVNRPVTRVRWRTSSCGTFRWRMTQERRYTAGYWSNVRGCRTWVEPVYSWHTVCRDRVYRTPGCGW